MRYFVKTELTTTVNVYYLYKDFVQSVNAQCLCWRRLSQCHTKF